MKRVAVEGAGLSPWEAEVLIDSIDEVYFSDPDLKELSCGQTRYSCVSADEGPGKPLSACSMATVTLTLIDPEDRAGLPGEGKQDSVHMRRRKLQRLTEEAREQGGLLTQEDLAALLSTDVRTIRRDVSGHFGKAAWWSPPAVSRKTLVPASAIAASLSENGLRGRSRWRWPG